MYKTYFGKKNNLKLFFKLNSIPRDYKIFEERIDIGRPKDRNKYQLNISVNNKFEIFLKENIYNFLPLSYLEGF